MRLMFLIRGFSNFSDNSANRLRKETECIEVPFSDETFTFSSVES